MRVRFSKLALAELDITLDEIRANNPAAASGFEQRVRRVIERIAQYPEVHKGSSSDQVSGEYRSFAIHTQFTTQSSKTM